MLERLTETLADIRAMQPFGRVNGVSGLVVRCKGLSKEGIRCAIGSRCQVEDQHGVPMEAEVVGFHNDEVLLMPFGTLDGIGPGCRVFMLTGDSSLQVNNSFIGRILNALGEPADGLGPLGVGGERRLLKNPAPPAGLRQIVKGKLDTGVRALNTFLTLCKGQRLGVFSGSGVGKSVLMGMMAKYSTADVTVIALVGERGREVREFVDEHLGKNGLEKSVVITATGDEPPLMRRQAAYTAMSVAEYFRDCGYDVMLMMDSVTRFAVAQREIGLSAGEPPTTRGFTPSVFAELPRLLERAGPGVKKGTITGIFTVLVEGSDMDEPIADAVRGILDGHIILDRSLAERGHFPAIDILRSVSRMLPACNTPEENKLVTTARRLLATYDDMAELVRLGAYRKGSDPEVDEAVDFYPKLEAFLQQEMNDHTSLEAGYEQLGGILYPLFHKAPAK